MNHHLQAVTEFFSRLRGHATTGGLLEGLYLGLENSVIGEDQLPCLLVIGWGAKEGIAPGAKIPVDTILTVNMLLETSRRGGWETDRGAMWWTFIIQDALERSLEGVVDPLLNGLLRRPLSWRITGEAVEELSIATTISADLNLYPCCRSDRVLEEPI